MIFDDGWLTNAKANRSESWANEVIESLNGTGQIYLSTLRLWFERFPIPTKDKAALRTRLESLRTVDHLGAVNELACWQFFQRERFKGTPLQTSSSPRPDFWLEAPADCFVEVSTLNLSEKDQRAFAAGNSVALNHAETIRRVLGKLTDQKRNQLKYAADKGKPAVLVLFDYTTWSAFGTDFFRALGDVLLGEQLAFKRLCPELSAVIYLERKVMDDGRIALSRQRSGLYHNPLAQHPLQPKLFPSLNEFSVRVLSIEPQPAECWISL